MAVRTLFPFPPFSPLTKNYEKLQILPPPRAPHAHALGSGTHDLRRTGDGGERSSRGESRHEADGRGSEQAGEKDEEVDG